MQSLLSERSETEIPKIFFDWKKFESLDLRSWLSPEIRSIRVFVHPSYQRRYPEICREILSFFQTRKSGSQNEAAKAEYGRLWVRNFFKHLKDVEERRSYYKILTHSLPTQPKRIGCFLGASPNLEKELDWILANKEKVFLLSSDTSLGFLLESGIRPNAVLSIDSGLGTSYHFPQNVPEDIPILTWFGGSTRIFELKNPKIIYLSTFPLDQILRARFFPKAPILENPSLNVSGLAISFFQNLGAEAILLKGFGFTREGGKTHCRASGYERYDRFFLNRKRSLYSARYSPESRWKTRTVVLDSLKSWSPIRIETELSADTPSFSDWEKVLEEFHSPFPGTGKNWRSFCEQVPDLPQEIRKLVPNMSRLLDPKD
ncbi:6-hydroxymethylpterin diphosphokinase MptE-like protein [Leptospira langatensis]|nr:6-hydroxymethylpterin diphosphokinase MptE-like protein [Leptospira langatensis]